MASLRFISLPSTTFLSTELQLHQIPILTALRKTKNQSHTTNINLSHTLTLSSRTKRTSNPFVLKVSATAIEQEGEQDQAVDFSSSVDTPREVSTTRLIVQNIPWECTAEDVRALFEHYGTVLDVELSMHNKFKNRGLAFVTFSSPEEAQAALDNIKEFDGREVKLNYSYTQKRRPSVEPKPPLPITFNLFVGNLPFQAKSKDLKEFFESECGTGSVVSAEFIYHENPRQPTGYGFIAFKSKKQAESALVAFEGKIFMGRPLSLQRSKQYVKQLAKEGVQADASLSEEN